MNVVSIFAGHDANLTFFKSEDNTFHVIEIERLLKKRYFRMHGLSTEEQKSILLKCKAIALENWQIENYDVVLIAADGGLDYSLLRDVFGTSNIQHVQGHHACHAASCFYQSPYDKATVISYDGGGDDGFFNVYEADRKTGNINLKDKIACDFGGGYLVMGMLLKEVTQKGDPLSFAGKLMGLCAYGNVIEELVPHISDFLFDRNYRKVRTAIFTHLCKNEELQTLSKANFAETLQNMLQDTSGKNLDPAHDLGIFEDQLAYDIAATTQAAFERSFFIAFDKHVNDDLPICMVGGASLNVLVNQLLVSRHKKVFVAPNPNDCGISLGAMCIFLKPQERVEVAYSGLPLLDKNDLQLHVNSRNATKSSLQEVAKLIKQGKIVGMVHGDSEVGPRALGNRSIVCDPSYKDMKDSLNKKVKFREWYRPFAPFCKEEDAKTYFLSESFDNMEFMSFAPVVKKQYREFLSSITHVDGTARLQTVKRESHAIFYDLLTEFSKISDTAVLLNTSFNVRGYPILSTVEDALKVLDETEIDYVYIEGHLFSKQDAK